MKRLFLSIFLFAALFTSCNNFKYKSRDDFKDENVDIRKEVIISILKQNDISVTNKYPIEYIDYVLTRSELVSVLERNFPTPDYKEFFNKAVPTLYYAYSPATYKNAPQKWKVETKKFLSEHIPYYFSHGEKKFRETIISALDKGGVKDTWLYFTFFKENEPEIAANGSKDNKDFYSYVAFLTWYTAFNFEDFKKLTPNEQGALLHDRFEFRVRVDNNKDLTQYVKDYIDELKEKWSSHSDSYLSRSPLYELPNDTQMEEVFRIISKMLRE